MTRADRLLLSVLVLACVASVPAALAFAGTAGGAVLRGPEGVTRVDLSDDGTYVVPGRSGSVVFEVRDGSLRCVSSECPNQICVNAGTLGATKPIVCAPNGVSAVADRRTDRGELDAVSR
ncbi:MAG: NusG domain II-containing protein [Actinomycetota bacterium]|nr:NusG domain II-containing protein [Actinomycetota bacterium]